MKKFLGEDFLLSSAPARKLYGFAEKMPIIDYHCHLSPREIYEGKRFSNITEVWLSGDHYKWRAMRAAGVPEKYVTGHAPAKEKFRKYAETLEKCIGNPLYHWSHMELKAFFGYEGVLNRDTADAVYELCNKKLKTKGFSARNLIRMSHVEVICTTDDPVDSLEWHRKLSAEENLGFKVLPAWRPDKALNIELPAFVPYMTALSEASGVRVNSFKTLLKALDKRMDVFAEMGCRASDHGTSYIPCKKATPAEIEKIFRKRMAGGDLTPEETDAFKTAFLYEMGKRYSTRGWVMQIHYNVKRNNHVRLYKALGPDVGLDSMANYGSAAELLDFLNLLAEEDKLPKTVLYSLNPVDNALLDAIAGCFQEGEGPCKVQHGAAWWFNDHKAGMTEQLRSFASIGVLGGFIGMLTDSRSFLSYPRHEYFRRILAEFLGTLVENGEYPADYGALKQIVEDVSYGNAKRYFGFTD